MGFIKNRSLTDNMRRLLHLMWMNQSNLDPIAAISLDAEKTFNGVEWEFLFVTWDKFGFGPGFVKWVKILYSNPKATVISNAITSSFFFFFFNLSRSTHQGCPLNPLLFILVLEPLASKTSEDQRFKGVFAREREHKLLLYADDILLLDKTLHTLYQ